MRLAEGKLRRCLGDVTLARSVESVGDGSRSGRSRRRYKNVGETEINGAVVNYSTIVRTEWDSSGCTVHRQNIYSRML